MAELLDARDVTLADLEAKFALQRSTDVSFFAELQAILPELAEIEIVALNRVKQNFLDQLQERLLIEETVKLVVVSPLLDLAGFYRIPYRIESEVPIQLSIPDTDAGLIHGRIDTLVIRQSLWVVLVEAKRTQLSVHVGIPQALTYLLSRPQLHRPGYGLVTNGSEFLFIKQVGNIYATSNLMSMMNFGNDLDRVLQLLRHLA